jgi:hypothetical protein
MKKIRVGEAHRCASPISPFSLFPYRSFWYVSSSTNSYCLHDEQRIEENHLGYHFRFLLDFFYFCKISELRNLLFVLNFFLSSLWERGLTWDGTKEGLRVCYDAISSGGSGDCKRRTELMENNDFCLFFLLTETETENFSLLQMETEVCFPWFPNIERQSPIAVSADVLIYDE